MEMQSVWPAVLRALRSRGLEFEDVQLAEDSDREDILREIFPNAPLYRAYANTMWIRLSRIISAKGSPARASSQEDAPAQLQPQAQQEEALSSLDIWTAFLSALSYKDLTFEDVQYAQPDDRWAMLQEVFPHNPLWRAQACSFWEQLCPVPGKQPGSPPHSHGATHSPQGQIQVPASLQPTNIMYSPPTISPNQLH
eukprot:TRINITY_DN38646_c0_g1_i1.p1 TRINITY_DN38646_c0_g1~~TRINITY_DN38646_c0_g1_i1.p1  ORF type:complete len:216 (+),score=29.84 TRINITY_DN38646_c0_g1_i1:61-648(+)